MPGAAEQAAEQALVVEGPGGGNATGPWPSTARLPIPPDLLRPLHPMSIVQPTPPPSGERVG